MARKAAKGGRASPAKAATPIIDEVRRLVELMVANDLGEVDVADGHRRIALKRASAYAGAPAAGPPTPPAAQGHVPGVGAAPAEAEPPAEALLEIRSPMVGTFYAAGSPDSEPYVAVGARVDAETVVCIIEAMKVMNEIKADCSGIVAEVCVSNAHPVEYGQVLFRVRPG